METSTQETPWWRVDLGDDKTIGDVTVTKTCTFIDFSESCRCEEEASARA
jgi:hypothetical protein